MHQNESGNMDLKRRVALKRLGNVSLGTITALIAATGSYQKPTLKKMMGLSMSAAQAASDDGTGGEVITP